MVPPRYRSIIPQRRERWWRKSSVVDETDGEDLEELVIVVWLELLLRDAGLCRHVDVQGLGLRLRGRTAEEHGVEALERAIAVEVLGHGIRVPTSLVCHLQTPSRPARPARYVSSPA